MDSGVPVPREVSPHRDLEYNERIGAMNEKEIGTTFKYSNTRISGEPLPDI
jgi:hypothetical protein